VLEALGALGLTGIAPALALAAATGLVLIQVGGISLHLSRLAKICLVAWRGALT
jgi:hypothetical protein